MSGQQQRLTLALRLSPKPRRLYLDEGVPVVANFDDGDRDFIPLSPLAVAAKNAVVAEGYMDRTIIDRFKNGSLLMKLGRPGAAASYATYVEGEGLSLMTEGCGKQAGIVRGRSDWLVVGDGVKLQMIRFEGNSVATEKPLIPYLHGGRDSHVNHSGNSVITALVAKGFPVFALNYRGSDGRGLAFLEANYGIGVQDYGKDFDAFLTLKNNDPTHSGRPLIIVGSSWGQLLLGAIMHTIARSLMAQFCPTLLRIGCQIQGLFLWGSLLVATGQFWVGRVRQVMAHSTCRHCQTTFPWPIIP